jgi:hypothetical protein
MVNSASPTESFIRQATQREASQLDRFNRLVSDGVGGAQAIVGPEIRSVMDEEFEFIERSNYPSTRFSWMTSNVEAIHPGLASTDIDKLTGFSHAGIPQTSAMLAQLAIVWSTDGPRHAVAAYIIDELIVASQTHFNAADALFGIFASLDLLSPESAEVHELIESNKRRAYLGMLKASEKSYAIIELMRDHRVPRDLYTSDQDSLQ